MLNSLHLMQSSRHVGGFHSLQTTQYFRAGEDYKEKGQVSVTDDSFNYPDLLMYVLCILNIFAFI